MAASETGPTSGINVYNEKSLHAALKQWYALPEDRLETRIDGFIIDLVREDLLVEIQTGSFSPLKRKLARLVETHPVRLVYPIPLEKWILTLFPGETQPPTRRKSPKRGRYAHVFSELVYLPQLMLSPNFTLEVLLIREEEVRRPVIKKHARSKGWVTVERRLLAVVESRVFQTPGDLLNLLPADLADPFSVRALSKSMGQPAWLARRAIYSLRGMGVLLAAGKKGRANLFSRAFVTPASEESPPAAE